MKFTFLCDNTAIARIWDGWIASRRDGIFYAVPTLADMLTQHYVENSESLWGISSTWSITDIGDGRWYVELEGPRHSLQYWPPAGLLHLAQRHWLSGDFIAYDSQRTDVGPIGVNLAPTPPHEAWVWDDPTWIGEWEDGYVRCGQSVTEGAFGRNY